MKKLLLFITVALFAASTLAQTNLKSVMVDTNGVVVKPANFWQANQSVPTYNKYIVMPTYGETLQEVNGGTVQITNNVIYMQSPPTNLSVAATRFVRHLSAYPAAGSGTAWGNYSHTFWVVMDADMKTGGIGRFVVGNNWSILTNIAEYPTNSAVGFEFRQASVFTNEYRLIARNGATATNGPWVVGGLVFQRMAIVVNQNRTNGEVTLSIGTNGQPPVLQTNATITGGPTNNGPILMSTLDMGIFVTTTNTNASGNGFSIYSMGYDLNPQ